MFKLSKRSKLNREGIDHKLIEISDLAIKITLVDFGHGRYAGLRTPGIQGVLFFNGKSKADGVSEISNHQEGRALDFYAYVDGKASWEPKHLAMVATAHLQAASILGYQVSWGGLWKSKKGGIYGWDMSHIELL